MIVTAAGRAAGLAGSAWMAPVIPAPFRAGRFWTDERIEAELREFTADAQSWPGARAFARAGLAQLYAAASLYGGIPRWRRRPGSDRTAATMLVGER